MKTTTETLKPLGKSVFPVAALALLLTTLGGAAQAQTSTPNFFLTSSSPTIAPGGTDTIFLNLVDGADDTTGMGNGLSSFDTNISFSNTSLTFNGPFVVNPSSPFSEQLPSSMTATSQRVAYDVPFINPLYNATGQTITLGSFTVQASASGLPMNGTFISLGSPSVSVNSGGSELINGNTFTNVLQSVTPLRLSAAPEPSGFLPLALGMTGLGFMAWRKRRMA